MISLFCKAKTLCAVCAMGLGLAAFATPTVTSVTAQQRYPWNGLVDIVVTINGEASEVANATCTFAATNSATKAALAIAHVTQVGTDTGSGSVWTRRFLWDTNADVGEVKIADVELVAEIQSGSGGVQLWEGGPYWAECNVGASKPEEYGYYFIWGGTVGHTKAGEWFNWRACPTEGKTTSELQSLGYIDSSGNLTASHDAATAYLGAPWRMPTAADFDALNTNCDSESTRRNGVRGRLVKGRGAYSLRSIFLPAAGYCYGSYLYYTEQTCEYWSSTPDSLDPRYARYLCSNWYQDGYLGVSLGWLYTDSRSCGMSVRPVRGIVQEVGQGSEMASAHFALDNRTGVRIAEATEQIRFSPAWETDAAGAVATVSTNGVLVASSTEAGVYEWTPSQPGTYQFTHAVYVNGVQVGETLSATFAVSGMSPISADWSVGSITLKATGVSIEVGENVWLSYCDANAADVSWEYVDSFSRSVDDVEKSICVTDTVFSSRLGGIPPVKYRLQIGKSKNDARVTLYCTTRTKRGIFVGVGEFGDDYGENKPERLSSASDDAKKFSDLMKNRGQMKSDECHLLTDSDATYEKVDGAFSNIASVVKPGDICVVYFSTHGGIDKDTAIGHLCLYDKPPLSDDPDREGYHEALLANHIRMLDPENKGVAVVNIISACYSGAFFDDSNEGMCTPVGSWCHKEKLSPVNVAWLTAASGKTTSNSLFDKFLFDYGWSDGWADADGDRVVSFLELANYTKRQYDGLFSGIVFWDESESRQAQISNGPLSKIFAGACAVHPEKDSPATPFNVSADRGKSRDYITIRWDGDPDADEYRIFYRFSAYDDSGWVAVRVVKSSPHSFMVTESERTYEEEYEDFLLTNENNPAVFVVKAINGAGISAASAEATGWVDALLRKVVFNGNGGDIPNSWNGTPIGGTLPRVSTWVKKGEKLWVVPTANKSGFTLCGWFNGNDAATRGETVIQEDVTYTAKWTAMTSEYLSSYPKIAAAAGNDIGTAANMPAANGCRTIGECYALGIDPEDPNDDFKIEKFEMKDGTPVITLSHTTDGSGNTFESRIRTLGKENLSDADWVDLTGKDQSAYRFFKVTVDLP